MVTIRDVSERANVSLGTVSRVLNGHPSVRPAVRNAVNEAIRELGYVPNPAARSLRSAKTHTLGLVVSDFLSPMTVTLVREVEDAGADAGYTVFVTESRMDPQLEETHIRKLLELRVDGLLISPIQSIATVERCISHAAARVPTVLIQLRRARREFPTAYVDEGLAIEDCVNHLAGLGHERVAILHSTSRAAGGRFRRDLLRSALGNRGITGGDDLERTFSEPAECYRAASEVLRGPNRATAILVGIHKFVPPTLQAIRDAGLTIPGDVSLIAFGDSDWAQAGAPPLDVIVVDQHEHASGAMQLLLQLLRGDNPAARNFRSESIYVRRESTGPASVGCTA